MRHPRLVRRAQHGQDEILVALQYLRTISALAAAPPVGMDERADHFQRAALVGLRRDPAAEKPACRAQSIWAGAKLRVASRNIGRSAVESPTRWSSHPGQDPATASRS